MISAKIIADSEFDGVRLVTFEVEFHRFILPEINTHRVFSRNYQSSRAVPVKSLIEQVKIILPCPSIGVKTNLGW